MIADRHAACDRGIGADPHTFSDHNLSGVQLLAFCRIQIMVEGCQHDAVSDQGAVSDHDAALILKFAVRIDKNVFPDGDVLAEIRVKRREQTEIPVNRFSGMSNHMVPLSTSADLSVQVIHLVKTAGRDYNAGRFLR